MEQFKTKLKNKNVANMLLGTLGVSVLGNVLAGKGINRERKGRGINRGGEVRGIVRAGYGCSFKKTDF